MEGGGAVVLEVKVGGEGDERAEREVGLKVSLGEADGAAARGLRARVEGCG